MTSLPLSPQLSDDIRTAELQFRIVIQIDTRVPNKCYVPTWMCSIHDHDIKKLTAGRYSELDDWLYARNWIRTQQEFPKSSGLIWDFISERVPVPISSTHLYHVTRTENVDSILKNGLETGTVERRNSNRLDTIAKIYFARSLGHHSDADGRLNGTATWWKDHFTSCDSVRGDRWTILSVDVECLTGENPFRDPWSATGLIYRTKTTIPTEALKIVGQLM